MSKKVLKFTKVQENPRRKFYSLSEPIKKVPNDDFDWEKEHIELRNQKKEEYRDFISEKGITAICISDAHTHQERLVFPAMLVKHSIKTPTQSGKDEYLPLVGLEIDGIMTMMIHGGDGSTMKEPEYYIKRIAESNNMDYEIIE